MSRLVVAIGHVEFTIASQTLYVVKVQQDADEWEVRRTYSDFRKLREDVARVMRDNRAIDACSQEFAAAAGALAFPAKKLFGSRRDRVVRERAVELHQFLIRLLLLTHTYRKAQKQLYDPSSSSTSSHNNSSSAYLVPTQQQASAHVFYLLRDFLKPLNGGISHAIEDENDESARRMIRESKMLTMRSSAHHTATKSMSAPNVLAHVSYNNLSNDASASATLAQAQVQTQTSNHQQHNELAKSSAAAALYRKQSTIPLLEEAAPTNKKTLNIVSLMSRSARTDSNASDRSNPLASADSRARNVSNASSSYLSTSSRKQSAASDASSDAHNQQQPVLSSVQGRKVSSASATGVSSYIGGTSTPVAIASSSSSVSSSSAVYVHGSAPSSSSSSGAASRAYPPSNTINSSSTSSQPQLAFYDSDEHSFKKKKSLSSSAHTLERRSKHSSTTSSSTTSHKKASAGLSASTSSATRSKMRSSSARDLRTSERKSKLSPQLTAQAVTINAQKELERYLSEYSAIMILRYVDRFISKAVTKAPGCYTVNVQRKLVIDSERFLEELDETFKDLPANFESNFRNPYAGGDWFFPPALDAYVQMKWSSFQGHSTSSSSSSAKNHSKVKSTRGGRGRGSDSEDDSEDSESEYEEMIGGGGGYMKSKKIFTDEEADVLDKMIADGTAGRDQMLRLRRQMNEVGWNRRAHPSGGSNSTAATMSASFNSSSNKSKKKKAAQSEYWTDTDDDETRQTGSSGGEDQAKTVEHYQQKYNALRKERLSRREGGLV